MGGGVEVNIDTITEVWVEVLCCSGDCCPEGTYYIISAAHSKKFAGSLGGGIITLIIVFSLLAAAVPTAVSGIYYKRYLL